MKNLVYAAAAVLCLMLAPAAHAFETPVTSDKGRAVLEKMGTDLQPLAKHLGATEFAWANFEDNGRVAALVYVPKGVDFKKSAHMVSMSVYALTGKPDEDKKAMTEAAEMLVKGYSTKGKLLKKESMQNAKGEPGLYLEYSLAQGSTQMYGTGVFMRLTSRTAAFVQVQSKGAPLPEKDNAIIRQLLVAPAPKTAKK